MTKPKPVVNRVSSPAADVQTEATVEAPSLAAEMPVAAPVAVPTVAQAIWADIKDRPIDMFGLPNQTPAHFCKPMMVEPTKLYLTLTGTASSVVSALETAFKHRYDVEAVDRYIVLSNKTTFPFKK
jgi:hypothetical protein